jgi:hypothetical protein
MQEGSSEWWLLNLHRKLIARAPALRRFEDYYDGKHDLSFVTSQYREQFGKMLQGLSDNWMELIVDAVEERLHVDGFRMGDQPESDKDAWYYWQRNCLDADSESIHSTALQCRSSYVMVWTGDDKAPEITGEHPLQTIVAYKAGSRRKRAAALKAWVDEWTGLTRANVYLPGEIHKFISKKSMTVTDYRTATDRERALDVLWRRWERLTDEEVVEHPYGVPIVELRNRPRLLGDPRSELESVLSTQDQINKLVCDMLIASEFAAFRQRWATGVEEPVDPQTGRPLANYMTGIDRLLAVGDPSAKFGEFGPTDLGNYVKAIENRVQSLASRTRTPPHYLLGQSGSFPSGESLKATETGLIAKCRSRMRHFGEGHEEVMRLAFLVQDDPRANEWSAETIWADPESRSEAEHTDSLLKMRSLGVPLAVLWEKAGFSQTEIGRFKTMLVEEALNRIVAGQPIVTTPSQMTNEPDPEPEPAAA